MARQLSKIAARGRALVKLPEMGRQLVRRIPEPVQLRLGRIRRRTFIVTLEFLAGVLVIGTVVLGLAYGRLSKGPVSLSFLVPTIEESINHELADVRVKIDDFIAQLSPKGAGVTLRLRNIRLIDSQGAVVAQAPFAAIGLSGRALLRGQIAAASVDFIGPRLLLFHTPETGLSVTFSRTVSEPAPDRAVPDGAKPGAPDRQRLEPGIVLIAPSRELNLTRTISSAFERARHGADATSYLTRFGVRDAVLIVDQNGRQSFWQVPDFAIDLEHKEKRSIILGKAKIASPKGPWRLSFRTEQSEKKKQLTFSAMIRDLIPSGIAPNFPDLLGLHVLTMPLDAETSVYLSTGGELLGAEAKLRLSAGHILIPWDKRRTMLIDEGDLAVSYDATNDRIEIKPSTLQWGPSRATISGEIRPVRSDTKHRVWSFKLQANDSILAAEEFGLEPMKVDRWEAAGTFDPQTGRLDLASLVLKIDDASAEFSGTVVDAFGSPEVKLKGRLSPMPVAMLKQIWPKFVAGGARQWVGDRVIGGNLSSGTVEINMPAGMLDQIAKGGDVPDSALSLKAEATSLEINYIDGLPTLQTGEAKLHIQGRKLALDVPVGWITLPSGKRVALSAGRFSVDDLRPDPQQGVIDFQMTADAKAALELLDHAPLGYVKAVGMKPDELGGRTTGTFRVTLPLMLDLDFNDIKLKGTAELTEARISHAIGKINIEGGAVTLNVTEKALEARGDILLNGVPALLTWQRIFAARPERQPEMRLTTILDEDGRTQLGLDVNHMIRGPLPVIMAVGYRPNGEQRYRVRADLTNADLILANMGWRKQPGHAAVLTFDIGKGAKGETELQNFRIEGRDIGIEGWISLGSDGEPRAFYFPDFSFNVITRLEIAGERGNDGIWDVQAHGSAYDGRQFFQSLFSAGQLVEDQKPGPSSLGGVNLTAKIGAFAGFFNTVASDVSISLQKRKGELTSLDISGMLNGTSPIAVRLARGEGEPRILLAETTDAGAAFRLVGFYPRIDGGQASLQVNLDAEGPASKAGTLWVKDFHVLGDRVVSEVLANSSEDPTLNFGERKPGQVKAQRRRIPFNQMRVPFSVGGGRFTVHDSYVNGPQLGATVRGYVDFKTREMEIGGTYVPVYGLNSALGSIPIIGNLLVGRRGEGVLGITFGIKGPMDNPRVLVNPVSMVAPGIFRKIFEYTGRSPETFPQERRDRQTPSRRTPRSSLGPAPRYSQE